MEPERAAGLVDVEPVRVEVVRDVEVGPPVAVHVGEDGAEAVVDVTVLDPGLQRDVPEPRVAVRVEALVQVEQVAERLVVRREAAGRVRGRVHVGVARDEDVGASVAVDVGDGGAGVPAERAEGVDAGGVRAVR